MCEHHRRERWKCEFLFNHTSYYFARKCDRNHRSSLVKARGMFLSKTSTCSSKCRYRSKLMFARAREWKNTTLSLPPENKLKNQISTNHKASLVLVFWHTHSERKNMFCLALPMRAPQARVETIWAIFGDAFLEIVWNRATKPMFWSIVFTLASIQRKKTLGTWCFR